MSTADLSSGSARRPPSGRRRIGLGIRLLALLGAVALPEQAVAHAPGSVLAWTRQVRVVLGDKGIDIELALAAGDALGLRVLAQQDRDGDGDLSDVEQDALLAAWTQKVAGSLSARFGQQERALQLRPQQIQLPRAGDPSTYLEMTWRAHLPVTSPPQQERVLELRVAPGVSPVFDNIVDVIAGPSDVVRHTRIDQGPRLQKLHYRFLRPVDQGFTFELAWRRGKAVPAPRPRLAGKPQDAREGGQLKRILATRRLDLRVVLSGLLLALLLGALHALSPGHGKAVVAAYLVGHRGTVRQAILLGLVVTLTHVASVLLLGVVVLAVSQYVLPQQLLPWLELSSGLLILGLGAWLLGKRIADLRKPGAGHEPDHAVGDHAHDEGALHQEHSHHDHSHSHVHVDSQGQAVGLGQLLMLGLSGGMVPCPSALVVLLAAIALHRLLFGMALIVVFSLGLALVLSGIGIVVVKASHLLERMRPQMGLWRLLPLASAVVITLVGATLSLQAVIRYAMVGRLF